MQILVTQAYATAAWMRDQGVKWELATVRPRADSPRVRASFVQAQGAGNGLVDMLFGIVENRGIQVRYRTAGQMLSITHTACLPSTVISPRPVII
jgi:hypothetical protein